MFTMRDYLVEAQRRADEIAGAQHHNLVKALSPRRGRMIGRYLVRLGESLVREGRRRQGFAVGDGRCRSSTGQAGASFA